MPNKIPSDLFISKLASLEAKKSSVILSLMGAVMFATMSCTASKSSSEKVSKNLKILATTTIVEDMIKQTLGDLVEVDVLMGPGTDPHLYVASPRDYAKIKEASIVVYSGLHLEAKLGDLLSSLSKSKEVVDLSSYLPKARIIVDSLGVPDPHFWFDPELWLAAGEGFAKKMQKILPAQKSVIRDNFSRWRRAVNESTSYSRDQFLKINENARVMVTSHDAFRYFGRFFEIEVMSVLGVSTDAQISIKKIENLVKEIRLRKIPAIFFETSVSPYAIQRLKEESGAKIGGELYGDSLGGPDTLASTYVGMLKHNAATVVKGLNNDK